MVKVGIIGLGHMGGYHASVCKLVSNLELVAVSDLSEENLKKINQAKIIKSNNYLDWIDKVDAIIVAVPTEFHYPIAKDCLLRKKHVLIEKPITKNIHHATELFELAEKQNCALHVGHVERFNGAVQELKKIINKPYLIESHRLGPFVDRVQKDSVVLDLMIHDLDIILDLANSPVEKFSIIGNKIKTKLNDIAIVQISFKNGVLANVISSRASQKKQRTMSIHQEDSFIKLDFTSQDISIYRNTKDSVKIGPNQLKYRKEETIERVFVYKDNPLKLEIENFVKSIKSGKKLRNAKKDITALELTLELEKIVEDQLNDSSNSRNWYPATRSMQKTVRT